MHYFEPSLALSGGGQPHSTYFGAGVFGDSAQSSPETPLDLLLRPSGTGGSWSARIILTLHLLHPQAHSNSLSYSPGFSLMHCSWAILKKKDKKKPKKLIQQNFGGD